MIIYDNFSVNSFANWSIYGPRGWFISNGALRPQDSVAYSYGFAIYNSTVSVNGNFEASLYGLDLYNGVDNAIILKFQDIDHFYSVKMNPGYSDARGIYFNKDNRAIGIAPDNMESGSVKIDLYNLENVNLEDEVYPNKTYLDPNGYIGVNVYGSRFDFIWYDINHDIIATGTHYDSTYENIGGKIGFFHTEKWNANIYGWDYISWSDAAASSPIITYFYPDTNPILSGTSTSARWSVNDGGATTTVKLNNIVVASLSGVSAISNIGNYILSAYNSAGRVSASFQLSGICITPNIEYFYTIPQTIEINNNVSAHWKVSGATSVSLYQANQYVTSSVSSGGVSLIKILSAGIVPLSIIASNLCTSATSAVSVSGYGSPPKISYFYPDRNPILSGSVVSANWFVSSGSANTTLYLNGDTNLINSLSGNYLQLQTPTTYTLSAYNIYGSDFMSFVLSAYSNSATQFPPIINLFNITPNPTEVCKNASIMWEVTPGNGENITLIVDGSIESSFVGNRTIIKSNTSNEPKTVYVSSTYGNAQSTIYLSGYYTPNVINSFYSDLSTINCGQSTSLRWNVSNGSCIPTVKLNDITVDLIDNIIISPSATTTYLLSAYDLNEYVTSSVTVEVIAAPKIISFSATSSAVCLGGNATINWETLDVTSAAINSLGWVPINGTVTISGITTPTVYNLSAYNNNSMTTSSTNISILYPPAITYFSASSVVCSGNDYTLNWLTSGTVTSAYLRKYPSSEFVSNLSASQYLSGTFISSADFFPIELVVFNSCASRSKIIETGYQSLPIANAGNDVIVYSSYLSGVNVQLSGGLSFDPNGNNLNYSWISGSNVVSSAVSFTSAYKIGTHQIELQVFKTCNLSAFDFVNVYVSALPPIANLSASKIFAEPLEVITLDGSNSTDYYNNPIVSYYWFKNNNSLGLTTSTITATDTDGIQTYKLLVVDSYGLSAQQSVAVTYKSGSNPIAIASPMGYFCKNNNTNKLTFNATSSVNPTNYNIVYACWDFTTVSGAKVCKSITNKYDLSVEYDVNLTSGNYNVPFMVSASNGNTDTDNFIFEIKDRPLIVYNDDLELNLKLECNNNSITQNFSAIAIPSSATILWNDGNTITSGVSANFTYYQRQEPYKLYVYSNDGYCKSYAKEITIFVNSQDLNIERFYISNLQYVTSGVTGVLNWKCNNADKVFISSGIGWISGTSANLSSATFNSNSNIAFYISAYNQNCSATSMVGQYILMDNSQKITKCKLKSKYIKIIGDDEVRFGKNRLIDLKRFSTNDYYKTDIYKMLEFFEDYLNTMYEGKNGYNVENIPIEVSACYTSACYLSAVNNKYTLTNEEITHGYNTELVSINKYTDLPVDRISILEKINRLTDLFDPDLIPLEFINYYTNNLGYNVEINRDQIGYGDNQSVEQQKYLRFMLKNLPYWYQIKTTKSAVRMMLYSYGLIGDFLYYYTSNYLNNDMKDWIPTNWNPDNLNEDIQYIPNNYFPTPHFKLYFDIFSSITNISYDSVRTLAIKKAVMAIKPLNTVFDGIVGYNKVEIEDLIMPYIKTSMHMVLVSDGYGDEGEIVDDIYYTLNITENSSILGDSTPGVGTYLYLKDSVVSILVDPLDFCNVNQSKNPFNTVILLDTVSHNTYPNGKVIQFVMDTDINIELLWSFA